MRSTAVFIAISVFILAGSPQDHTFASGLTVRAGLGYDFLSQEYFLDSAALSGPDSTITAWALTTDYLDDVKGQLWLTYSPHDDGHLRIEAAYDQTPEFLRGRLSADHRFRAGKARFRLSGELEGKNRYRGTSEFGDSYLLAETRTRLSVPLSKSMNVNFQVRADGVRFESASIYNYDYYRLSARLGLDRLFEDFSLADFHLSAETRRVPDSSELCYVKIGGALSYFGLYGSGDLDLQAHFEKKDYQQPDGKDDHYRLEAVADHRLRFGRKWFSRQEIDFELTHFDPDDAVNVSYSRLGIAFLGGLEGIYLSLAGGPDFELLDEQEGDQPVGEDYWEVGGRVDLDYLKPGKLLASVQSILGKRNLKADAELQSDFLFERVNLIGDLTIAGFLRLNLLFSAEWEWHEREEDDCRTFLLSTNLSYTF